MPDVRRAGRDAVARSASDRRLDGQRLARASPGSTISPCPSDRGEIVGVAGVEGNGQSELAAVLSGMAAPSRGRVFLGDIETTHLSPKEITAAGIGVVPEDRHAVGCVVEMSVAENIFLNRLDEFHVASASCGARSWCRQRRELMTRFDVRAGGPEVAFSALSGGNQQKAVLAREITLPKLVCSCSRRSRHAASMSARWQRSTAISARPASAASAVLLISSELDELIAVADRIVVLYRGRIMGNCARRPSERERIGAMMAGQGANDRQRRQA